MRRTARCAQGGPISGKPDKPDIAMVDVAPHPAGTPPGGKSGQVSLLHALAAPAYAVRNGGGCPVAVG